MTKRFSLSLEENEISNQVSSDVQNTEIADLTTSESIISTANELTEAIDVHDSNSELIEVAKAEVEETGEIQPGTAAVLQVSTEHFTKRLGLSKKLTVSKEQFASDPKNASLETIASLENFNNALANSIGLAEEGFIDDVKTSIGMSFTTQEKVQSRLSTVSETGYKPDVEFHNDTWAKYLPANTGTISGKDIIRILEDSIKDSKDLNVKEIVKELSKGLQRLIGEVRGNWFYSNKRDIDNIISIGDTIQRHADELKEKSASHKNKIGSERTFITPTDAEAKKIKSLIQDLISSSGLDFVVKELNSKSNWLAFWSWWNTHFRLKSTAANMAIGAVGGAAGRIGSILAKHVIDAKNIEVATNPNKDSALDIIQPADLVKARQMAHSARVALVTLNTISVAKLKTASAIISYLEQSSKV